jgi:hypothetical protein
MSFISKIIFPPKPEILKSIELVLSSDDTRGFEYGKAMERIFKGTFENDERL